MERRSVYWAGCVPIILGVADVGLGQIAALNYGSTNWSGYYADAPLGDQFTDVQSTFVVPTLKASSSGTTYSSCWVGIDGGPGGSGDTVEQCGIFSEITSGGSSQYYAWWEFAPASLVEISTMTVHPGDTITAEVTYEPSESSTGDYAYLFDLHDLTDGGSFDQAEDTSSNDPRITAEWIDEAPTINSKQSTMANFGTATFYNDVAALNGGSDQTVGSLDNGYIEYGTESGSTFTPVVFPSPLNTAGNTFNLTYGTSTESFTWDNAGGPSPGDGKTWDIGNNNNWNNGTDATFYSDGSNVTFNDTNNGHYAVTLNTTVAPGSVTVNSSGNYTISGSGTIGGGGSLSKLGAGTLWLSTANTYTGGTYVSAGTLVIDPTSSTTSALPKGALTISGGKVQLAADVTEGSQSSNVPSTAPISNVNITSLSISGSGTLDITDNHIVVDYSGTDPIASIAAWIANGYAGGTWTGTGIASSTAAANASSYGIGYADAADAGNPAGLSAGQIEIMYTLLGDANLDGKVNGTDFNLLATNFNQSVTDGWDEGDFNYDGKVNGEDFNLLAVNFNQTASQSADSAADLAALNAFAEANSINLVTLNVPEPTSAAILIVAGSALLRRRRSSRQAG